MSNNDRSFLTAFRLRQDLNICENLCIDLNYLTERLMIKVRKADLGNGIEGVCKSQGIKRLVILNQDPYSVEKERFTLAHEIGHILIHHGSHYCKKEFFNIYQTQNNVEKEANAFATELLLPKRTMLEFITKNDLAIALIRQVAKEFEVSMSVSVIRLVQLYSDCAVAIRHDGHTIHWKVRSESCFLKMTSKNISTMSLTSKLNNFKSYIRGDVDPKYWIDEDIDNLKCEEETIYFTKMGQYLTILKFYEDY